MGAAVGCGAVVAVVVATGTAEVSATRVVDVVVGAVVGWLLLQAASKEMAVPMASIGNGREVLIVKVCLRSSRTGRHGRLRGDDRSVTNGRELRRSQPPHRMSVSASWPPSTR